MAWGKTLGWCAGWLHPSEEAEIFFGSSQDPIFCYSVVQTLRHNKKMSPKSGEKTFVLSRFWDSC